MTKTPPTPAVEPSDAERSEMDACLIRNRQRPPRVRISVKESQRKGVRKHSLDTPHSDRTGWHAMLREALGTSSSDFVEATLGATFAVIDPKGSTPKSYSAALALFGALAPRDELEATMAAQIVTTNHLSMDCMARAATADTFAKREAYINQSTKLSRTLLSLFEGLGRYRTGGQQKVTVVHEHRHVYVAPGGQAIVSQGDGGGLLERAGQSHALSAALPGADTLGIALSGSESFGPEAVPDARRDQSGRAEGAVERQLPDRASHEGISRRSQIGDEPSPTGEGYH